MAKDNESKPRGWQDIAAEAVAEPDSDRLLQLVQELEQALEERERRTGISEP